MENNEQEQSNAAGNFAVIETHLQVSNLIKILLTIPYDILKVSVENIPDEVATSQHARVLNSVLAFYSDIISLSKDQKPPVPQGVPEASFEVLKDPTEPEATV